jgi:short-subunit dehydrogenase
MPKRNVLRWSAIAAGIGAAATVMAVRQVFKPGRDFEGKVVVITGGSRGLGLALAKQFGRRGAKLAICAREEEELAIAERKLSRCASDVFTEVCDIAKREQVQQFLRNVRSRFGRIDVLVNNAGIIGVGPVQNQTLEHFEEAMAINFWGAVYTSLEVLPEMTARGKGNIVNISSIGGKVAVPHLLPYTASKFALTGFSEGLAAELHGTGIQVTTVCPGLMRTGSQFHALFQGQHQKEFAWFLLGSSTPLTSINAERAAKQIIEATKRGKRELIIGWQAELLARVHGILPEATLATMARVNQLLPTAREGGHERFKGSESESLATRIPISVPSRWAARRLNEARG